MHVCTDLSTDATPITVETSTHLIEGFEGWLTIGTHHFPDDCVSLNQEETQRVFQILHSLTRKAPRSSRENAFCQESQIMQFRSNQVTLETTAHVLEVREGCLSIQEKRTPGSHIHLNEQETQQAFEVLLAASTGLQPVDGLSEAE